MEHRIFAYGTLRNKEIRKKLLGYSPAASLAKLKGFRMESITLDHVTFPIIIEDSASDEIIDGECFTVNEEQLKMLDHYESEAYNRKKVILDNGLDAWIYYK